MGSVERHGNRTWLVLMCGLMVLPAPAGAKRPKATADIPVQADFRQNLEAKGWSLTPQVAEIYKVGNLYSSKEFTLEAEDCVSSATKVEGEFMSTETEGNAGFAISADVRGVVVSARGQVSGKKYKLSSIKDTRIAQIPGMKFNLSRECKAYLERTHAGGRDVTGWFILQETVSALVTDRTCVGHEEALQLRAALLVGNAAAVNTGSCTQTSSGNGVVAYKAKTVGELLPGLKPAVAANTSPPPMPAPAPAPPPASKPPPPTAAPAPAPPVDDGHSSDGFTNSIGMKFVRIEAGSFEMGSPSSESGRDPHETEHRVALTKSFMMATTEVTQGHWRTVMRRNPSNFSDCGADCPVEQVSWHDAVKFANALSKKEGLDAAYEISGKNVNWNKSANGYRLPTEAEWEYAARGGESHVYSGSNTLSAVGWTRENSGGKPHKVADKRANARDLYDMTGNVYEWCWDWYGKYSGTSTDPVGAQSGGSRVLRGGSWNSEPANARVAYRLRYTPDGRGYVLGLRLVRTVP